MDIREVVKTIRQHKIIRNAIFNQRQRVLLGYQRKKLLETDSSGDSEQFDHLKLAESENPWIRLMAFNKIRKILDNY